MVIVWHPSQTNAITVNFELDRHAFAASTNMPVFATPQDLFFEYFLSQQCHQTKCPLTTKLHVRVNGTSLFTTVESFDSWDFVHQHDKAANTFVNFNALATNDNRNSFVRFHPAILNPFPM